MTKKKMSFWQMFNLNFGFLGIQFGWALQMANMSGIYKFLGADNANMGYLWLAAPLSGMLIQPILGQISAHIFYLVQAYRHLLLF
jgi:maltose/moltooligosaccharide transporter